MKWLAALISCIMLSAPALAREILPAERRDHSYEANLPACEDPSVLADISSTFATREHRFWNSSLRIVAFEQIRPVAWRPWGLDYIPRRFCTGTVVLSDGYKRRVNFSIGEDLGFIGIGWDTQACIDGQDYHYAFAPHCRQAAP